MKKQERHLSFSLHVCFTAALTIAVGQNIVCYNYRDPPLSDYVNFHCDAGKIIIVNSAVIGVYNILGIFQQCPTSNDCLNEITPVSELCTGRNSCDIYWNFLFNVSQTLCIPINNLPFNTIKINYTCIFPALANYGDICHYDEDLFSSNAVYISSFPKLPEFMGPETNYQCSCRFTPKLSSSSAYVTIRALLVQLTGKLTNCSERLSITDSRGDNKLEFCSPCNSANNVTTVSLAVNTSATVISFRRDSIISPFNGKFILEITVSSESSGSSLVGSMKCEFIGLVLSNYTTVSEMSSSSISSSTTSALLSQPSSVSSPYVQNTLSGTTLGSSITATNAEQSTLSSSESVTEKQSSSVDGVPTLASQTASDKTFISTGGIIGIVLGSVGLIVIVVIALLCLLRKRKQYRDHSKENINFTVQPSHTVMQNTFQSTSHFSNEHQTRDSESNFQTEDNSMSNYEEGAPVSIATYGPGMIQANEQRRLRNETANDLTTETQSMNSGNGDVTLVENQLYVENANPVTGAVVSDEYDVARPVSNNYDVARPVSNNYDVARPVVQDGGKEKPAKVDGAYAVVQPMTNSVDHSYYNVPAPITTYQPVDHSYNNVPVRTGNGTDHSPVEVSAEAGASSASDESAATNPMYKADSDVVLIDNTLYGSMLGF